MSALARIAGAAAATGGVLYAFSAQTAEASTAKKPLQRRPSWEEKFSGSQGQRDAIGEARAELDSVAKKRLERRASWESK